MTLRRVEIDYSQLANRVVALRLEGHSYDEIMALTNAPRGTISSMLARERARSAEIDARLLEAERKRARPTRRFDDDPRAEQPDYGRLPMRPATETGKGKASSGS